MGSTCNFNKASDSAHTDNNCNWNKRYCHFSIWLITEKTKCIIMNVKLLGSIIKLYYKLCLREQYFKNSQTNYFETQTEFDKVFDKIEKQ